MTLNGNRMPNPPLRRIPFEKIENFRDLGGYASRYGATSFGVVYRSAELSAATASDVERLANLGIKTIIDIRDAAAKKEKPDRTLRDKRFKTISLSVNGDGRIPVDGEDQVGSYLEMLEGPLQARRVFLALAHAEKLCLIHCTAGKDRTGAFVAVLLAANGVAFDDINADYLLSFPYLMAMKTETMRRQPDFPKVVLEPNVDFLGKVFGAFFERYGSVESYFEAIGLAEDDTNLLANLLGRQEKSCGAVVFHEGKVLVEHMGKGHYSLPKGHVELADQGDKETALREIKEETGLEAKIISDKSYAVDYSPEEGVAKRVLFFAAEANMTGTTPQPEEIRAIYWLSPEDAIRTVSHISDKKVIRWACGIASEGR